MILTSLVSTCLVRRIFYWPVSFAFGPEANQEANVHLIKAAVIMKLSSSISLLIVLRSFWTTVAMALLAKLPSHQVARLSKLTALSNLMTG